MNRPSSTATGAWFGSMIVSVKVLEVLSVPSLAVTVMYSVPL
jgi:hypothetical protein